MGIDLPDVDVPIGSLSGGQRQCVAIARAVFFGARVLILDEPTAALGVKQSGVVLKYITAAKEAGFGVVFITHNPHHAHMVGDHFVLLNRGQQKLDCTYDEITLEHLTQEMAGGDELEALSHELRGKAHNELATRRVSSGLSLSTADLDRRRQRMQKRNEQAAPSTITHWIEQQARQGQLPRATSRRQGWFVSREADRPQCPADEQDGDGDCYQLCQAFTIAIAPSRLPTTGRLQAVQAVPPPMPPPDSCGLDVFRGAGCGQRGDMPAAV